MLNRPHGMSTPTPRTMRPFTEVEATFLESGWELLWDSEEDQPVEDEAAHSLITGDALKED